MQLHAGNVKFSTPDPQDADERKPPYSLEAEQALLGVLLLKNEAVDEVIDFLEPGHFYDRMHGAVYGAIRSEVSAGRNVSPITLKPLFENHMPVGDLTVPAYLGKLAVNVASTRHVRDYGRTIYDTATRRQLILIGEEMIEDAREASIESPPADQIEEAETKLYNLVERQQKGGEVLFQEAVGKALKSALAALGGKKSGIPTGFSELDDKLGGLHKGNLVILAGRPGMAKSALAINVAVKNAKAGRPVGFFSLEMSDEEIATRVLGDMADIPPDKLRKGTFELSKREHIQSLALHGASKLDIIIDQTGGLSIAQLASRARRMQRRHGIQLVIVDYLQLMHAGRKTENRVQDVSAITVGLKALAKELNLPVFALSQLSRAVEGRDNKRPQLSDLRESGSIEQDADVVLFIYREEYYLDQKKPPIGDVDKYADWNKTKMEAAGKAEIIIGKSRQGPTGIVNLQFADEFMRFSNLASNHGSGVNHAG